MCGERSTATNQPQSCLYIANTSEHSHMLYTERTAGHTMANQRSHWHWIIVATRSETIRDHQRRATTIDDRHRSVTWSSLPSLHYHRLRVRGGVNVVARRARSTPVDARKLCARANVHAQPGMHRLKRLNGDLRAVWQLQPKVAQTVQQHVTCLVWIYLDT